MMLDEYLAARQRERSYLLHLALMYRPADVPSLLAQTHIRTCISPDWHKKLSGWYHAGQQVYHCAICERLNVWIRKAS